MLPKRIKNNWRFTKKVYDDLKIEKKILNDFISNFNHYFEKDIIENNLIISCFKRKFINVLKKELEEKRRIAYKIINKANDVSSLRKLFFSYNSKMEENRIRMLKEISSLYKCKNLSVDILEGVFSNKEKDKIFCNPDCTEELGKNIINICEEEYKKSFIADNVSGYCMNYIKSIDLFGKYIDEFLNFKLNGYKTFYDCELIADKI